MLLGRGLPPVVAVLSVLACRSAAPNSAQQAADPDPFPAVLADECGHGTSNRLIIKFEPFGDEPPAFTERLVEHIVDQWRRTGGPVLVEAHVDGVEASGQAQDLDLRRAQAAAALLIRAGVDAGSVWMRTMGFSKPMFKTTETATDPLNRRVEIKLPTAALHCALDRVQLRAAWFERHCLRQQDATALRRAECANIMSYLKGGS